MERVNDMNGIFNGAFKDKKILVTGHTGFKGAWLSLWLADMGAHVSGFSRDIPSDPSLFDVLGLKNIMTDISGDICDGNAIADAVRKAKPEYVFHAAAQPLVRKSYVDPVDTFATNVMGTLHVFEAVRAAGIPCTVIAVTSDKCYENREWIYGYRETEAFGGHDPYSASKGAAEILIASYRRSYWSEKTSPVRLASVRAGNVIGGGDWAADRLIPDCIRSLSEGKDITIRNPEAVRPWQHVLEPLSGYLWLAARLSSDAAYAEGWNFGPTDDAVLTVKDVVERVIRTWGSGAVHIDAGTHAHEAKLLTLDTAKARRRLSWHAALTADEAVERTVSWYKKFYTEKNADMKAYTRTQIAEYVHAAKKNGLAWASGVRA